MSLSSEFQTTIVTIQVQFQVKSKSTLSSTDPTSYLEDRVVFDKVPDVQLSLYFHRSLTHPIVSVKLGFLFRIVTKLSPTLVYSLKQGSEL